MLIASVFIIDTIGHPSARASALHSETEYSSPAYTETSASSATASTQASPSDATPSIPSLELAPSPLPASIDPMPSLSPTYSSFVTPDANPLASSFPNLPPSPTDGSLPWPSAENGPILTPSPEPEPEPYPSSSEIPTGTGSALPSAEATESYRPASPSATLWPTASSSTDSNATASSAIAPMFAELNSSSVIVYTFDELKTVLSEENNYTTIYLGANIETKLYGIRVHKTKTDFTIDGRPPGESTIYTLKEYRSGAYTDSIVIQQNNSTVTLQNLRIDGQNYYGTVVSPDAQSGVTLIYKNVDYTGPQITYNRNGYAEYYDCNISIVSNPAVPDHEVAEARSVLLGGTVRIDAMESGRGTSIFWLVGSSTKLTVAAGADVNIDVDFYFVYADGSQPDFIIENNASFIINCRWGMQYAGQVYRSVSVGNNATLKVNQQKNEGGNATFRINSKFEAMPGSVVEISRPAGAYALIEFSLANCQAVFDQPKRVILSNPSFRVFNFIYAGDLSISTQALNYWVTADLSDSINNMPQNIWNKKDSSSFQLSVRATTVTTSALSHSLDSDDPVTDVLSPSTFNMGSMRMLVLGDLPLSVSSFTTASAEISGQTSPNAGLQAVYQGLAGIQTLGGNADGSGYYHLPVIESAIPDDAEVLVLSHYNMLKARQIAKPDIFMGILEFASVPEYMLFQNPSLSSSSQRIPRQDPNWTISISDTRSAGSQWRLEASIDAPLQGLLNGQNYQLPNALVYVNSSNTATALSSAPLLIFQGTTGATPITDLSWPATEGILVDIPPYQGTVGVVYETTINWTLMDTP